MIIRYREIETIIINEVMTFAEATKLWGLSESTLRSSTRTKKLIEGVDFRKSGKVWLITREAMIRVYGNLQNVTNE